MSHLATQEKLISLLHLCKNTFTVWQCDIFGARGEKTPLPVIFNILSICQSKGLTRRNAVFSTESSMLPRRIAHKQTGEQKTIKSKYTAHADSH